MEDHPILLIMCCQYLLGVVPGVVYIFMGLVSAVYAVLITVMLSAVLMVRLRRVQNQEERIPVLPVVMTPRYTKTFERMDTIEEHA